MALKLDDNLLTEIGLGALPTEEKGKMLRHIYETLEMRVGVKLAERMSEQQLQEFETFINSGDDAGALRWLETTFPDYKDVVKQEFDLLKAEITQVAPQIVAESTAAMSASQQPQSPQEQQLPPQPPQQ